MDALILIPQFVDRAGRTAYHIYKAQVGDLQQNPDLLGTTRFNLNKAFNVQHEQVWLETLEVEDD